VVLANGAFGQVLDRHPPLRERWYRSLGRDDYRATTPWWDIGLRLATTVMCFAFAFLAAR
jgi:hypothetical protein